MFWGLSQVVSNWFGQNHVLNVIRLVYLQKKLRIFLMIKPSVAKNVWRGENSDKRAVLIVSHGKMDEWMDFVLISTMMKIFNIFPAMEKQTYFFINFYK